MKELKEKYSFDERKLVIDEYSPIATITMNGLLVLNPKEFKSYMIPRIRKFIKDYTVIGFYNKESEKIYNEYIRNSTH